VSDGVGGESSGNGSGQPDEKAHRLDHTPRGRLELPPNMMTPEQGCLSCGVGLLLLLASALFWLYIYWRNEPSFHPQPVRSNPPASHAAKAKP